MPRITGREVILFAFILLRSYNFFLGYSLRGYDSIENVHFLLTNSHWSEGSGYSVDRQTARLNCTCQHGTINIHTGCTSVDSRGPFIFSFNFGVYDMSLRGVVIDWVSVCLITCEPSGESANERDTDVINIQCQCRVWLMDGVKSFSFILKINFTYTSLSQVRVITQNYVEQKI